MIMKELTDEQWLRIRPLFPRKDLEHSGSGRPRQPARDVLEGTLWARQTHEHYLTRLSTCIRLGKNHETLLYQ